MLIIIIAFYPKLHEDIEMVRIENIAIQHKTLFGKLKWKDHKFNPFNCRDANGEMQGRWEMRFADGSYAFGHYVGGKMHGQWKYRLASGTVTTGQMVDDKPHGQWELRRADGVVNYQYYVNGELQDTKPVDGIFDHHTQEASETKQSLVCVAIQSKDGKWQDAESNLPECHKEKLKHGQWELRFDYGMVQAGPFVDGVKQGQWEWRLPDGTVSIGQMVDDLQHGEWEIRYTNGMVGYQNYVHGELQV